ncbi:hypothetical protein PCANC_19919 [Puccinia coronata f. sp. avenae]|uniref:Uncharacterized protein n=1 Tax=Puccinia coronata f. sp. avenae TaxID=200324 RepID=A0A2N5U348_9BASI|nr:hypothetical protein PCANC_19919 [Puccinia coronata f. sp. avenae]
MPLSLLLQVGRGWSTADDRRGVGMYVAEASIPELTRPVVANGTSSVQTGQSVPHEMIPGDIACIRKQLDQPKSTDNTIADQINSKIHAVSADV